MRESDWSSDVCLPIWASIYGFVELLLTQNYDEETRRGLTSTLMGQVEAMGNIVNESLQPQR
jgi:hypothetical protein